MVSQEPVLFSSTIAENIAFGRLTATDEEIEVRHKHNNNEKKNVLPRNASDSYV